MPVTLDWRQVAIRLTLTVIAGLIIGFNRGEHGRPAGMRTTLLVCLAASLSMIQANLLMNSVGKLHDSFVVLDLMRLPLRILSGMGFIGAGAILRKDNPHSVPHPSASVAIPRPSCPPPKQSPIIVVNHNVAAVVIPRTRFTYGDHGQRREIRSEIQRRVLPSETHPPAFVAELAQHPGVETLQWKMQGVSTGSSSKQEEPKGTPPAISPAK